MQTCATTYRPGQYLQLMSPLLIELPLVLPKGTERERERVLLCSRFLVGRSRGALYAQTLIVVAFLVVNFFGFLVITRNPTMRFGPKLEEIFL